MRRLLAITMLQRGLVVAVYVVATMILARVLTPAQIGVYSLSAAFLTIVGMLREFGVGEYLMQEKTLDHARIRAAFGVALAVGWSAGLLVMVLRHPIAQFYGEPGVARVLAVMALTFSFLPFGTPMTALLYRDLAVEKVLWIQAASVIAGHAASVGLALAGYGYMSLAWGNVVNSASMVLWLMVIRRDGVWYLPTLSGSRPIWSYCGKFTASGLLEQSTRNFHELVIGRRFGFAALGLYSRASGLFLQIDQNIGRSLSRVLLPNFAQRAREGSTDLAPLYVRTLENYTAVMWPFFGCVAVVAPEVIRLLLGEQWSESGPLLRLLCVGAIVQCGYAFAGDLLGGLGQAGARLRITSVAAPLWIAMCGLASVVSLQAIAAATALQALLVTVMYWRQLHRLLGLGVRDWLRVVRQSAPVAILVVAVLAGLRLVLLAQVHNPVVVLLLLGLAAGGLWLGAVSLTGHPVKAEIGLLKQYISARFHRR